MELNIANYIAILGSQTIASFLTKTNVMKEVYITD